MSPRNVLNLKPTHKAVTTYYSALAKFEKLGVKYETAVRSAFQELLEHCARQFDWKLVPEYPKAADFEGDSDLTYDPKASLAVFRSFARAGEKLADLHVNYESASEFELHREENNDEKLDWRVEAMKLGKNKDTLLYNDFLTLRGIPDEAFGYRLGNRSALEWLIDQYRVTRDDEGNILKDPNRVDDDQYILRLIGKVVTVSLETRKIVAALPAIEHAEAD